MSQQSYTHGSYIRAQRQTLGISQSQLARLARLTPAMICRLEAGSRRGRPALLRSLAEALEVPAAELLERAGYVAEARYWQGRPHASAPSEGIDLWRRAVHRLPLRPSVQSAVNALAAELTIDREQAHRERFDRAATRQASAHEANGDPFTRLRADLFNSE